MMMMMMMTGQCQSRSRQTESSFYLAGIVSSVWPEPQSCLLAMVSTGHWWLQIICMVTAKTMESKLKKHQCLLGPQDTSNAQSKTVESIVKMVLVRPFIFGFHVVTPIQSRDQNALRAAPPLFLWHKHDSASLWGSQHLSPPHWKVEGKSAVLSH